jgi:hypothetical protein
MGLQVSRWRDPYRDLALLLGKEESRKSSMEARIMEA